MLALILSHKYVIIDIILNANPKVLKINANPKVLKISIFIALSKKPQAY